LGEPGSQAQVSIYASLDCMNLPISCSGYPLVKERIHDEQYRSLAELRYQIRLFLQRSDATAREMGMEPQQYQLLLAVRAMEPEQPCTIRALSERLLLKHHSAVELVDRMEANNLVIRSRDQEDRRQVFVHLHPKGEQLLARIVLKRLDDVSADNRTFLKAITSLMRKEDNGNGLGELSPRAATGGAARSRRSAVRR
jgi:DNA-binding MarR family transcriptional regulator